MFAFKIRIRNWIEPRSLIRALQLHPRLQALICCMREARRLALASMAEHFGTLLFLLVYFWVVVITAIDYALFYAVFPYRYFVVTSLLLLLALVAGRSWRFKMGLLLILMVWFSVLPRVSWHSETNFFINAGSLRKGMTLEQAATRMRPFLMTVSADGRLVWFQPRPGAPDLCMAEVRNGRLRRISMRPG